ncbi:MAG: hypothetical protein RL033_7900 [Pseudomonadota bacterium]|jgi:hypothetical protein
MKTQLSFYLIAAVAGALACSDEGGSDRNSGGNGGTGPVAAAGSSSGGSGQGTAGSSSGGNGGSTTGAGGAGSGTAGPLLTITGTGLTATVTDTEGTTGITGGIALAQSATMATAATLTEHEGQLCMRGVTAVVPDSGSYGTHWGAELSLDLKRAANPNAPVADAGADAGGDAGGTVLGTEAVPWPAGNVIGFSYKITGNDPAITADQGVSSSAFRFKAVPKDANTAIDTYCSTRSPLSNATERVLFSDITFECWQQMPPNPSLAADPIAFNVGAQGMPSTRPNPHEFMSISWQIPADLMIQHSFDFCISELRPILAP